MIKKQYSDSFHFRVQAYKTDALEVACALIGGAVGEPNIYRNEETQFVLSNAYSSTDVPEGFKYFPYMMDSESLASFLANWLKTVEYPRNEYSMMDGSTSRGWVMESVDKIDDRYRSGVVFKPAWVYHSK